METIIGDYIGTTIRIHSSGGLRDILMPKKQLRISLLLGVKVQYRIRIWRRQHQCALRQDLGHCVS